MLKKKTLNCEISDLPDSLDWQFDFCDILATLFKTNITPSQGYIMSYFEMEYVHVHFEKSQSVGCG